MSDQELFLGTINRWEFNKVISHLTGISQPVNERRGNYVGPFLGDGGETSAAGDQEGGEDDEVEEMAPAPDDL